MKKRYSEKSWIPFWIDKWIFGSMRIECTVEERAIWIDLLALAAKDKGFVRANENIGYPIGQLSGLLIIPEDKLRKAISKFVRIGKLERTKNGVLYVVTWETYQFSDRHKRRMEAEMSEQSDSTSEKTDTIGRNRIEYNKTEQNKKEKKKIKKGKLFIFPPWLPLNEFEEYMHMRKQIKKPMTDCALKLAIKKLEKLKEEGHDPKAVLEQSVFRSWIGLFPLKESTKRDTSWTKKYDGDK